MPERVRDRKLVATFQFFADEAGNAPDQPHFVFGGYLSHYKLWDAFAETWDKLCSSWGIDAFHMTEAEALDGDFAKWNPDTKDCRVAILAKLVSKHIMHGFACDVRRRDYDALVRTYAPDLHRKINEALKSPYVSAFAFAMLGLENACRVRKIAHGDVKIVFARRGKIGQRDWHGLRMIADGFGFAHPEFQPAAEFSPLQAADMLAWRIYQNCVKKKGQWPVPKRHLALLKRLHVIRVGTAELKALRFRLRVEQVDPSEEIDPRKRMGTVRLSELLDNEDEADS